MPSSTAPAARLACPAHGLLEQSACASCDKQPYDLSNPDELSVLKSLRVVAKSERTTKLRFLTFPLLGGAVLFFGNMGALNYIAAVIAGEVGARVLEPLVRQLQPAPRRALDRAVL